MTLNREQTISEIARSSREIFRVLSRPALDWPGLDLSMAQLKALIALAGREPTTVGMLGQMLQIQLPAASHAAKGLVRLGLARRLKDPNDRRCTYIRLTPYGEDLVDQMREGRREALRTLLSDVADEDLAAAHRGLAAIAAVAIRNSAGAPGSPELGLPDVQGGDGCAPCVAGLDIHDLEEER